MMALGGLVVGVAPPVAVCMINLMLLFVCLIL
jgi:hypothetical protein